MFFMYEEKTFYSNPEEKSEMKQYLIRDIQRVKKSLKDIHIAELNNELSDIMISTLSLIAFNEFDDIILGELKGLERELEKRYGKEWEDIKYLLGNLTFGDLVDSFGLNSEDNKEEK